MSVKLNNLQQFVKNAVDTAWRASQIGLFHDPNPTGFGQHLEFTLQARSGELTRLLNEIAEDELNQVDRSTEPIDFTKFVRISNREFNHKEVFVGDKWVFSKMMKFIFKPLLVANNCASKWIVNQN